MAQPEFFDRHTGSFVFLCGLATAIGYALCSYVGWNQPARVLIYLLLTELLLVALGVLAMLLAEKWFVELDASTADWAPLAHQGKAKTFFNSGLRRTRPTFDHTGDYLRMVAQEMQAGADGSYFGAADPFAQSIQNKGIRGILPASQGIQRPATFADALQIVRPVVRSTLSTYVPPPLPVAPASPVSPSTAPPAAITPPSPPMFVAQTTPSTAASSVGVAPTLAAAMAPATNSANFMRQPGTQGTGPIVAVGTPPGTGGMRPKPPRHRSA